MKEKASHLKRPPHPMPEDIKKALHADGQYVIDRNGAITGRETCRPKPDRHGGCRERFQKAAGAGLECVIRFKKYPAEWQNLQEGFLAFFKKQCSVETGMNFVSSHRNHENRGYESSPPQGPSRGTAGQITGFFNEYGN